MTTADKAEKLEQLASYEGCELGDFWCNLVNMYEYQKDYMTEEFWLQIGVEIEIHYQDALDMIEDGDLEIPDEVLDALSILE